MTYTITPQDLKEITRVDEAFGTTRFLPSWEDIPKEFKQGNSYTRLVENLFFHSKPGDDWTFNMVAPFTEDDLEALSKCINAHLNSWEPKYEHKIAGVAYMISKVIQQT